MYKPYPLFIGLRYVAAKRRNQLVSFISMIAMLGMTVGVALLILVLSVMNGFDREMQTRILGLVPHITILSYSTGQDWQAIEAVVRAHPEVRAIAPFTQLNAMLLRGTEVEGVQVFGIDPARERAVSIIQNYIGDEDLDALAGDSDGIILGSALARRLQLKTGATVNLMVSSESSSGRVSPRFARLQVKAIFDTGTEIDQSVALIGIEKSRQLMPADKQLMGLRVSVNNTFDAPRIGWELSQNIPYGYITRDWTRTHGNLYSAIQLSKQLVGLMLTTIIAVAAFNVVSALVMIVTDKRGDIAILRTAGASSRGIMAVFMVQGTAIALLGTLLGSGIGVGLSLAITNLVDLIQSLLGIQFLQSDVYPVDYLPSDLRWQDVALVCATAFGMSVLATLYPSWKAARVQPADALRYE